MPGYILLPAILKIQQDRAVILQPAKEADRIRITSSSIQRDLSPGIISHIGHFFKLMIYPVKVNISRLPSGKVKPVLGRVISSVNIENQNPAPKPIAEDHPRSQSQPPPFTTW